MALETPAITLKAARRRAGLRPGVPSPCISVCEMDEARNRCKGCFRTLEEIGFWSRASDADKLLIWQQIETRQLAP